MENGLKIYSMDKERNFGPIILNTKDNISLGRSKALDGINGVMVLLIRECGMITN